MKPRDVILVQLEFAFGSNGKALLKEKVNEALDKCEWQEDFDIAVTGNML